MQKAKVWKFDDHVDTDQIIASQYLLLSTVEEMKCYCFESLSKDFAKDFKRGDAIVSGYNFGCGSSREQAPAVLKAHGVSVIIARSFARIFFRNSINIGLPLITCDELYLNAEQGDEISFSFKEGRIISKTKEMKFAKYPDHINEIIENNGLINYVNLKK